MSSIVTPPTASASQPPATPPPVAAAATGTPPPAPAAAAETPTASSDITITSTTDTAEQVAAALEHKTPAPTTEPQAASAAATAAAAPTPEDEAAAAASEAGRTLSGRKKTYQQRLDEVVYEREENRRLAERAAAESQANAAEAARLKAENEALRAGRPVPGTTLDAAAPPAKPTLKDFEGDPDPYQAYTDAVATWTADRAVDKAMAEVRGTLTTRDRAEQGRQAAAAAAHQSQQTFDAHRARVLTFKQATPDYDATVEKALQSIRDSPDGTFDIPPVIVEHIQHTETGPALFYHLAQDQTELRRIAGMTQVGPMLVALGRYEAKLDAQGKLTPKAQPAASDPATRARDALTSSSSAAAAVTTAPAPPPLVGTGSTASTVPLDQLDYQDYAKQRNAQERARRR